MKTKTQTPAPATAPTPTAEVKAPRVQKPKDAAVIAAEAALAKAKADAKAARELAREAKPKAEPRPTCTATKHNGEPCTAKAKQGQVTCVDHTPAWVRLTAGEQTAFQVWMDGGLRVNPDPRPAERVANELGWHRVKALLGVGA
jgi:hypothetical protein